MGDLGSIPGSVEFHGQRVLVGYSPWDREELDTAERLTLSPALQVDSLQSEPPGKP